MLEGGDLLEDGGRYVLLTSAAAGVGAPQALVIELEVCIELGEGGLEKIDHGVKSQFYDKLKQLILTSTVSRLQAQQQVWYEESDDCHCGTGHK